MRNLLLALLILLPTLARAEAPQGPGWRQLRAAPVTFHYSAADEGIAKDLAAKTPAYLQRVERATAMAAPRWIDVILAPTADQFEATQPSAPPAWAAGTAWPSRAEVYLRSRSPRHGQSLDQVYVHELLHVVLGRGFRDGRPPRWLDEGLARVVAGETNLRDRAAVGRAALTGRLLSLETLTGRWPAEVGAAHLAYVQSVDFVGWLSHQESGALPALVQRLASGEDPETALRGVTGRSLPELEADWAAQYASWRGLLPVVGSPDFAWTFVTVLFVVAAVVRRRRIRRQLAAMEERERLAAQAPELSPAASPIGPPSAVLIGVPSPGPSVG
jgi:hypothetical protein